jgi:uncharacterized membrane protein YecN with MAPEG domain
VSTLGQLSAGFYREQRFNQVGRKMGSFMDSIAIGIGLDPTTLSGPIWVTLIYVALYYGTIVNVLRVKVRSTQISREKGEAFDRYFGRNRELLAADRVQLNMLEHMPIFLVLLWLHALVGSINEATVLGGMYVATRLLYPIVLPRRIGRNTPNRILWVTFPGYFILTAFAIRIAMAI